MRNHFAQHIRQHKQDVCMQYLGRFVKNLSPGSITAAKIMKRKLCHLQNLDEKKENSNHTQKSCMLKNIRVLHNRCPACFLHKFAKEARHQYLSLTFRKCKSDSKERCQARKKEHKNRLTKNQTR